MSDKDPETEQEVAEFIDAHEWDFRTYNGGRWQVYTALLIHVVEVDKREEAERICKLHNAALAKRRKEKDHLEYWRKRHSEDAAASGAQSVENWEKARQLERFVRLVRWNIAFKVLNNREIVADFSTLIDYCNTVLNENLSLQEILKKGLPE